MNRSKPTYLKRSYSSTTNNSSTTRRRVKDHEWGFGLALETDLLYGTSSPSTTFGSPSLSRVHADRSKFEISNIELEDEAETIEEEKNKVINTTTPNVVTRSTTPISPLRHNCSDPANENPYCVSYNFTNILNL